MLGAMSTAVVADVEVVKRVLCASCHGRLGAYRVAFTPDGVALLAARRMPRGVIVRASRVIDWYRNVSALQFFEIRYEWKCPCGATPRRRATTLARQWKPPGGTEYV
jgi:hypothetical protein